MFPQRLPNVRYRPQIHPRTLKPEPKLRSVATWLPENEYDLLVEIAKTNGVNVSTYLRAIINDALAEEGPKVKTLFTTKD